MKDRWTPNSVPSLAGKRVLITGANSGIGYETALILAKKEAHILFAARDKQRGQDALDRLHSKVPGAQVELVMLDLASLDSIRRFTQSDAIQNRPLDILINNAGVLAPRHRLETADGFELQFGTNVLGHFSLTALLMPALRLAELSSKDRPRIVTVSSIAHKNGSIHFDDLQSSTGYFPMVAYQQSKLADLIFAIELNRRLSESGSRVMSVAAHPGVAHTNLFIAGDYSAPEVLARQLFSNLIGVLLNTGFEGAWPTLYAATSPAAQGGGYYGPQELFETRGRKIGQARISARAKDGPVATRLWQACEDLTGITFRL